MNKKGIFFTIGAIVLIGCFYPVTVLQVIDGMNNHQILYQTTAKPFDQFSVRWIHSVSKQPVIETYEIQEDFNIIIYEMVFNENGPNLPAGPEGGTKWEIKGGFFRVYNYQLVFDAVPVRIGQVIADHTLIYKGKEISLKEISRPGGFVKIRACKVGFIKYFFGGVKLWLKST